MTAAPARHRQGSPAPLPAPRRHGRQVRGVPGPRPRLKVVPGSPDRSTTPGSSKRGSKLGALFRSHPVRCSAALMVVSAVVFGLVLLNIHVAQTSFRLTELQQRASELQTEQRRLRYEVARAESPEKVVEMSNSLGLVPPPSQQYLEGPSILVADQTQAVEDSVPGEPDPSR